MCVPREKRCACYAPLDRSENARSPAVQPRDCSQLCPVLHANRENAVSALLHTSSHPHTLTVPVCLVAMEQRRTKAHLDTVLPHILNEDWRHFKMQIAGEDDVIAALYGVCALLHSVRPGERTGQPDHLIPALTLAAQRFSVMSE